ncbi:MAG: M50 family metallopeptidase [Chloroflexi bacterium]|nr:M50 family metallopeptidase [Chloroflexota bacterium]
MTGIGNTILSILEFILAFGSIVFLHEFGHFIFARLNKIEVEEFGFGYPPKIVRLFKAWGTEFSLNWIPFGGFCRLKEGSGDASEKGSFLAANPWRRLLTLLGGPIINLIIGMIIISFLFTRTGAPDYRKVEIIAIAAGSPAETADLQVGDLILEVANTPIDSINKLSEAITPNLGKSVVMVLARQAQTLSVTITPRLEQPANEGPLGVTISNPVVKIKYFEAIPMAFSTTIDQGVQLLMLPVNLISGQIAPSQARMVSVKGIYDIFAQVQTIDKAEAVVDPSQKNLNTYWFLAIISIALGFSNLLPIPALDGGRILFLLPELLFKKKIKPELEGRVHMIGYFALIGLMVVMVINDILNPVVLH